MSYTIAVAGKGGTGKTTIAALIIRLLVEGKKGSVLAIDADPNNNLGQALGLRIDQTIGSIINDIARDPSKIPSGMTKERFIEFQVHTAVVESNGFDTLTMGRPEGPGCYCYVNNVLRGLVEKMIKDYDYTVIDNEAGFEHLARRTTRDIDSLVIISDATAAGTRAAKRIIELVKELELKVKKSFLLVNRAKPDFDKEKIEKSGGTYLGCIPLDGRIEEIGSGGNSLFGLESNSSGIASLRKLGESIWQN